MEMESHGSLYDNFRQYPPILFIPSKQMQAYVADEHCDPSKHCAESLHCCPGITRDKHVPLINISFSKQFFCVHL